MARFRFMFGTMAAGKSTLALQIAHNLAGSGASGFLGKPAKDQSVSVASRLGVSAEAVGITPSVSVFAVSRRIQREVGRLDFVIVDDAHFCTPRQVEQMARVVDEMRADVFALGLLTDFRGHLFRGSTRLLELADERLELRVEARCWCGARATHQARFVDGARALRGKVHVAVGAETSGAVTYEIRCRRHWLAPSGKTADYLPPSDREAVE